MILKNNLIHSLINKPPSRIGHFDLFKKTVYEVLQNISIYSDFLKLHGYSNILKHFTNALNNLNTYDTGNKKQSQQYRYQTHIHFKYLNAMEIIEIIILIRKRKMQSSFNIQQIPSDMTFVHPMNINYEFINPNFIDYNQVITELSFSNFNLSFQIQSLKQVINSLTNQLDTMKAANADIMRRGTTTYVRKIIKTKKLFKKDKICTIDGCHKKYSSRIALNTHYRTCHPNRKAIRKNDI